MVLPAFNPAFDLDGVAAAEPFFQFVDRELHSAVPAGDGAVFIAVALVMGIAAYAGVEESAYRAIDLEQKVTDILSLILVCIKVRDIRLKGCCIDDDGCTDLSGRRVGWLPCA